MQSIRNQRGVALLTALIMSLIIMAMVTGVLYFVTQSTKMSGAGKRYATADEAATGATDVMKDSIDLVLWNGSPSNLLNDQTGCFVDAVNTSGVPCVVSMRMPDSMRGFYNAEITFERLFSRSLPGGRLEFARAAGGAPSTAIFYRINTVVTGPGNSKAETSALYRFAG